MTPDNWQDDVAPSPGDNLLFQGVVSAGNTTNNNNFPDGTVFGSISIATARAQYFTIGGNRVVLTNGFAESSSGFAAGGAYVFFDITLAAIPEFQLGNKTFTASGSLTFNNTIDTDGNSLIISNAGGVVINGTLINNSTNGELYGDSLVKTDTGTLTISSSATIAGEFFDVELDGGTLVMDGVGNNARFDSDQGNLIVDGTIGGVALGGAAASVFPEPGPSAFYMAPVASSVAAARASSLPGITAHPGSCNSIPLTPMLCSAPICFKSSSTARRPAAATANCW
jgi:hypothetical protein